MASQFTLFIDDGGVMNDNNRRAAQWQRFVGEFFTPLLGGTVEAWQEANRIVTSRLFDPENWDKRIRAFSDYASFDHIYQFDWLCGMCEYVGLQTPPEEECVELAHHAATLITGRVHATFPGAIATIRSLHQCGYSLHTASGESSSDLAGILGAMRVRDCFGRLYGPDLINTFKNGPEYYERIFADVLLSPEVAVVVDDSPRALNWASQVGAKTIHVSKLSNCEICPALHVGSLAEILNIIEQLA